MEDSIHKSSLLSLDNLKFACQGALNAITFGVYRPSKFGSDEEGYEDKQDMRIQYMEQGQDMDLDNIDDKVIEQQRNWEIYETRRWKMIWK